MTKASTTITINGRLYDAATGRPIENTPHNQAPKPAPQGQGKNRAFSDIGPRPAVSQLAKPTRRIVAADSSLQPLAQKVHQQPQKSHTLYRKALQKPLDTPEHPEPAITPHTPHKPHTTQRSPLISHFGTHQQPQQEPAAPEQQAPVQAVTPLHPSVAKALQRQATQKQAALQQPPNSKELKEQLIKERLAEVSEHPKKEAKQGWKKRQPRLATILTSTLALLVLGGYLTYIHLPDISMRVAASRAGINASLPSYRPDGYSLNGPITYAPGEVAINYKSNTNDNGFRLTQKATNWDSQAVLDNFVTRHTDNYLTYQQQGVTVYTFGNKAAWVNGGQLYVIDGNATLSSEQVLRLATSL